ncbi:hypothetical protein SLEP1_g15445 [Rubroshorea leprosula]|uniref:AtpF n=1 Tax=Rubroshorea leprosula TaxID=152421 RepID=A0AAV5IMC3_9ROSI|nr:hypothetical protein SLEP1_g15445 [Rubroshorea leprosula]
MGSIEPNNLGFAKPKNLGSFNPNHWVLQSSNLG